MADHYTTQPLGEEGSPHSGHPARRKEAESCPPKGTTALHPLNSVSLLGSLAGRESRNHRSTPIQASMLHNLFNFSVSLSVPCSQSLTYTSEQPLGY